MIYRREREKVHPSKVDAFNAFFHEFLLPLQAKHGARLVGRWVREDRREIMALWAYRDRQEYEAIEQRIRADEGHRAAQARRRELEPLFEERSEDFLEPTGDYEPARFGVAEPLGVTGVYFNATRGLVNLVLRGRAAGGALRTSDETGQVQFVRLTPESLLHSVTRPHFQARVLDAMTGASVPLEAYHVRPYARLARVGDDRPPSG